MIDDIIPHIGEISFRILDLGARPVGGVKDIFYSITDRFPTSEIIAVDVDKEYSEMIKQNRGTIKYFPAFIGRAEETRPFYETVHPMCNSLYKPNSKLLEKYQNLEPMKLKKVTEVNTVSLDYFRHINNIGNIDFIKIDVQGAELDVFSGGISTLKNILGIVSEVEFIPLYEKQPLFGDVCKFLSNEGLNFIRFFVLRGRSFKPALIHNNPEFATNHLWSDALFLRNIKELSLLNDQQLLKMGIIADMYNVPDISVMCFMNYDKRKNTRISEKYLSMNKT